MSDHNSNAGVWTLAGRERFRLAAIDGSSNDAVIGTDLIGIVTDWNRAVEDLFGYAVDEIVGRSIARVIPSDRLNEEASIFDRICRGERTIQYETERHHRNSRVIPVLLILAAIRDGPGRVIGVSMIVRDLGETRRLHREPPRREALLRSVLEAVAEALVVIDGRGLIWLFSAAAERLFGFTAGEVVGQNVSMLMPAPYRQVHDTWLARYAATGEPRVIGSRRIVVGQRKDGTTFPMDLALEEAGLLGERLFAGVMRALTERRDDDGRNQESRAGLSHVSPLNEPGHMISALSHEMDQPLTAMGNAISGARRLCAFGDLAGAERALERIAEQADRVLQTTRRLRDHARGGRAERQVESVPTTIEEACALALLGACSGLKPRITIGQGAGEAVIDRLQIQHVLINLIRNAVEAMANSERRELAISAVRVGEMVEIRVADTGPGLPELVRARLFEPFVTTRPDGMGMGLSVCRTIVEAHGGEIRGEDRDGGGTVFRLTVPCPGGLRPGLGCESGHQT